MNIKLRNLISITIIFFTVTMLFVVSVDLYKSTHSKSNDTTSIVVERLDSHSAIVNYSDDNTQDYLYVEIEYPDADYTTEEHLNLLIVEAIDKLNRTYQGE